ncbi:hypothetical protein HGRIS_007251 [Hohenbuehelia grisea]|uniref:dihydroneopterin aldolase n=1 Tax=Hohenbuehelia grisea TaxID=104357 RepID=A0ABR3JD73_9AGAR
MSRTKSRTPQFNFPLNHSEAMSNCGDIVLIDSLQLAVDIGPDCWDRPRSQPAFASIYLHLAKEYLDTSAASDDVRDSVHYGHLAKSISELSLAGAPAFQDVNGLQQAIAAKCFALAGRAAVGVRVVVDMPKMILLASGFRVDVTVPPVTPFVGLARTVSITDMIVPVIIGVNPPERESKQRVIVNITIFEAPGSSPPPDYRAIISSLHLKLESTAFLTLEKFVMEAVRFGVLASDRFEKVTVRAQKPSALAFAHSSGVEITRSRAAFSGAD